MDWEKFRTCSLDDYSMVYLSKTVCKKFPKIMMGMICWCFYREPEYLQCL